MKAGYGIAIFALIFALGGLFWWWQGQDTPVVKNAPSKPKEQLRIIAVGDSLVAGYGATAGHNFVSLLSRRIGIPITNHGVSGDTSGQVLERIGEALEGKPDVVILLVGGNDALQKIPKEKTFQNIATIIEAAQGEGSAVVLIGVQGGIIGDKYQDQFDELAEKYQTAYVPDILDGLIGDSRYMSDYIHPNDKGYEKIAEKIATKMDILFQK